MYHYQIRLQKTKDASYTSLSKRNGMENVEAHPENYCHNDKYPFCSTYSNKAYEENVIFESEDKDEEEEEDVGENSKSFDSSVSWGVFDAKVARILIAKMILIDKLPLKYMEEEGFRRFVEQTLCEYAPRI